MASQFTLKLIDKLSQPALGMARALERVFRQEQAVTAGSAKVNAAIGRTGMVMGAAAAKARAMASAFQTAARVQDKFKGKSFGSWSQAIGPVLDRGQQNLSLGDKFDVGISSLLKWNRLTGEGLENWGHLSAAFMRTPLGFLAVGLTKVGGAFLDLVGYMASALLTAGKLTVALGALAAIGFTKMAVEMGAFAERSKQALAFIAGSGEAGRREFKDAVMLSKELGINVEDAVAHYSKLRSMQFSPTESAGLVRLSTDLKAITGDSQAAERALTAMTQIKAKGKLQSEELVGQLAEAGVSTVLVYKELEKMLGTDRAGVLKKLQGGQIDSETGLVAVVRALKQKYHVGEVGIIGEKFAENTLAGMWESIKNAPARMFLRIGEQIDTRPLVAGLKTLRDAFDSAFSGGGGVSFVNAMVAGLSKLIPLTVAFAEGFGSGLESIAQALSIGEAGSVAQWARDAGASTAEFFTKVIEFGKKAIPVVANAGARFLEAFDANSFLDKIGKFDWKGFGESLAVIAEALGKVMGFLGSKAILPAANVVANPTDALARNAPGILDFIANPGISAGKALGGFLGDAIFGGGEGQPPPLRADPRIDPAMTGNGMTNNITIPVTVNASGGSPEEHAAIGDAVWEKVKRGLRQFTDNDLAQATG